MKPRVKTALYHARIAAGKTQAQVAQAVGLSRASYTNIELKKKNPSLARAQLIAKALCSTVDACFPEGSFSDLGSCVKTLGGNPEQHTAARSA